VIVRDVRAIASVRKAKKAQISRMMAAVKRLPMIAGLVLGIGIKEIAMLKVVVIGLIAFATPAWADVLTPQNLAKPVAEFLIYHTRCGGLPEPAIQKLIEVRPIIDPDLVDAETLNVGIDIGYEGQDAWCARIGSRIRRSLK
jgi:hypothetical protein